MRRSIALTVNGLPHAFDVPVSETLLDLLRERLDLTGAKLGCDQQVCGTCTTLVDGLPVSSCSVLAVDADGADVLTVEGLEEGGTLHPIQRAFVEKGAFQCAYCTPGFVLTVKALLDRYEDPSEDEMRHFLSGNICRCGAHFEILEVVRSLVAERRAVAGGRA